ncbi:MAG: hypothetical protein ACLR8P_19655 [Clostridium fessum]
MQADPALLQEFTAGVDTRPYNQPENQDEQAALTSYLNQNAGYRHSDISEYGSQQNDDDRICGLGAGAESGRAAYIPFGILYKLGRLGNLYVYAAVLYFAIKKTPVGKAILMHFWR